MAKNSGLGLGVAVGGLIGAGAVAAYFLLVKPVQAKLPTDFAVIAARLSFKDVTQTTPVTLKGPVYLCGGVQANGFEYHVVGYSLVEGGVPQDIIVSIARNVETPTEQFVNVVKIGDDAVEVWLDAVNKITLPLHAGQPEGTLLTAKVWYAV